MWVLCDINAAYVSFCQLFNPQFNLEKVPLGVLSSNQGNVVARNDAIKMLGIKMGEPAFKIKDLVYKNGGHLWGSNFNLFGDLSDRFHTELEAFLNNSIRYSVDEGFGCIDPRYVKDTKSYGVAIQKTLKKNLGIGCGVGISHTMTLAKLASHCAKSKEWKHQTQGVVVLDSDYKINWALHHCSVGSLWGVGGKTESKLNKHGIYTGLQLKNLDISWVKRHFNITLARTVEELRGTNAVQLNDTNESRNRICVSQSMGKTVATLDELTEAITSHCSKAAFKLRRFDSYASKLTVFIHTDAFNQSQPQHHQSQSISLPQHTADTSALLKYALFALKAIYKPNFKYKKAGVVLESILSGNDMQQLSLLEETIPLNIDDKTKVLDEINKRFGTSTIKLASEGFNQDWRPKDDLAPSSYTTKLNEIPIAKA
ncbi:Y-family DNA polymerase [Pseudoalteromonas nigrifaciens]|uniref:Y-family DNA polymerase n=1 Tax=Pseudoalteromonas nigrifaciens TaxID=28109 RepID=UPI003FCFC876